MAYQRSNAPAPANPASVPVPSESWWKNLQQQNALLGRRPNKSPQRYKVRMGGRVVLLPAFGRVKRVGQMPGLPVSSPFIDSSSFSDPGADLAGLETENPFEDTESFGAGATAPPGAPGIAVLPISPTQQGTSPGYLTPTEAAQLSPTLTAIPGTAGYSLVSTPTNPLTPLTAAAAGIAAAATQQAAAKQTLQQVNSTAAGSVPTEVWVVGGIALFVLLASNSGRRR
jgi:hypothetical protein